MVLTGRTPRIRRCCLLRQLKEASHTSTTAARRSTTNNSNRACLVADMKKLHPYLTVRLEELLSELEPTGRPVAWRSQLMLVRLRRTPSGRCRSKTHRVCWSRPTTMATCRSGRVQLILTISAKKQNHKLRVSSQHTRSTTRAPRCSHLPRRTTTRRK